MNENLKESFDEIFSIGKTVPNKLESDDLSEVLNGHKPKVPVKITNYEQRKVNTYNKAQRTIDSLLKFYVKEEIISEDDYIAQRALQEKMTLSELMNQIENVNDVITTMMKNIDSGDVSPRMFEVLSEIEKTFIELLKMKSMHLIQVEDSMKRLINDRKIYGDQDDSKTGKSKSVAYRGTKNLMRDVQQMLNEADEADID